MNKTLRVSLVQTDLVWLDPDANLQHLKHKLSSLSGQTDLIVLPEMFTSGFTEKPEPLLSNQPFGFQSTAEWMLDQARALGAAVTGSIACQVEVDNNDADSSQPAYVNRLIFATPEGHVYHYDKCHLFQMGGEHERYRAGNERKVVEYHGWKILLTICYDLRFPVFCRNQNDYELMLCVANWPQSRRLPWRTLLQARAIENQAYVVGVNRVGSDGNGLDYSGDCMAIDYFGKVIADGKEGQVEIFQVELDKNKLNHARDVFPAWQDADAFELR